jgi:DNA replication and repair protein RecF
VRVDHLGLVDFRNYPAAELDLAPEGLTVVVGDNGHGKTNLLEALAYLATLESFRGVPREALVRVGASRAVVRAEGERQGRTLLIEAEIAVGGRDRIQVNRQPLRRSRDLLGALRVTVFSPDDLELVKGGPGLRRRYLDELAVAVHPRNDALRVDLDRVLRQRATLLKQAHGYLDPAARVTLEVWDAKLAEVGGQLADARADLVDQLAPEVAKAYSSLCSLDGEVAVDYRRSWTGPLLDALAAARDDDLRRGVTTVGPHRDELFVVLDGLPARTHASQGEQRSLALALRLAGHAVVTSAAGSPPVLLLDDVFSELDRSRCDALAAHLPAGQAVLTSTGPPPPQVAPAAVVRVERGVVASVDDQHRGVG